MITSDPLDDEETKLYLEDEAMYPEAQLREEVIRARGQQPFITVDQQRSLSSHDMAMFERQVADQVHRQGARREIPDKRHLGFGEADKKKKESVSSRCDEDPEADFLAFRSLDIFQIAEADLHLGGRIADIDRVSSVCAGFFGLGYEGVGAVLRFCRF